MVARIGKSPSTPRVIASARCSSSTTCYHLTGRFVSEKALQTSTGWFDLHSDGLWEKGLAAAGIDGDKLPEILECGEKAGPLTEAAAQMLGLEPGIPVVTGAMDQTAAALAGGGPAMRPGEISLAHNGVLFLDELPEFQKNTLDLMRQPLEDHKVTISRVSGSVTYPAEFMLVCAMNPCKCGYYGDPSGRCSCSEQSVRQYRSRISGPLLDRIDIIVEVPAVEFEHLRERRESESSAAIKERVNAARARQHRRFGEESGMCNGSMGPTELRYHCVLDDESAALMKEAFDVYGLTARSYDRILKVARTIADLEGSKDITSDHIAEAIQYRIVEI